jgi:phosphoribosylaminoimidazolecarboxamide formyltransferase/IMP cyclohydrolase
MYRNIHPDLFPGRMTISFEDDQQSQSLVYEKVEWVIGDERQGLRYGENPDQEAALFRLVNGNLCLGDVECIQPGRYLLSDVELVQSGKHPGKINITDADSALNILRYFQDAPCAVIIKHNNPCGVALGETPEHAFERAYAADRLAAFGGAVAINREIDSSTAERIASGYVEVVAAPSFSAGALGVFAKKKNLRVLAIQRMDRLADFVGQRVVDFKSLIDGGLIVQWSFVPQARTGSSFIPAQARHEDREYRISRSPTPEELSDMVFGWLIESGVTSNSVIYVKDGATVGIGTGEQDRVGVAEIARDKAYRKLADRLSWEQFETPYNALKDDEARGFVDEQVRRMHGGLEGSTMISDGFFPFRDGAEVGLREGVRAVVQPGGSVRDWEVIEACNEYGATMVFTGQRSFRH